MTDNLPEDQSSGQTGNIPEPGSETQTNPYAQSMGAQGAGGIYNGTNYAASSAGVPPREGTPQPQMPINGEYASQPGAYPGGYPSPYPQGNQQYNPNMPLMATQNPGYDGLSIASLITGILGVPIIPIVLGAIGLNSIKKTGKNGKGLAIAGIIIGAIQIVAWIFLLTVGFAMINEAANTSYEETTGPAITYDLDELYQQCADGNMESCDTLYIEAPIGSDYEKFADTCGNRVAGGSYCFTLTESEINGTDDA